MDFLSGISLGSFLLSEFILRSLSVASILTLDLSSKALASFLYCSVSGFFSISWSSASRKSRWNSVLASESLSRGRLSLANVYVVMNFMIILMRMVVF